MEKSSRDIYKEHVMKLWRNPKNFGELKNPTHEYSQMNNICGDEVLIQMKIEEDVVKDIKFFGVGCLVCIVFASELTEKIKGMKIEDIKKITKDDVLKLLDVDVKPGKMYCACLALEGIQNCIKQGETTTS